MEQIISRREFLSGAAAIAVTIFAGCAPEGVRGVRAQEGGGEPDLLDPFFDGYGILTDRPLYVGKTNLPIVAFSGYSPNLSLPTQIFVEGAGTDIFLADQAVPGRRPRIIEVTTNPNRTNSSIIINPFEDSYVWGSPEDQYKLKAGRVYFRTEGDRELSGLDAIQGGLFQVRTESNLLTNTKEAWGDYKIWTEMPKSIVIEGQPTNYIMVVMLDGVPVRAAYDFNKFTGSTIDIKGQTFDLKNVEDASRISTIIISDEPMIINDSGSNPRVVIPMPGGYKGQVTIPFQPTTLGSESAGFAVHRLSRLKELLRDHYDSRADHSWLVTWLGNPLDYGTAEHNLDSRLRDMSSTSVGGY